MKLVEININELISGTGGQPSGGVVVTEEEKAIWNAKADVEDIPVVIAELQPAPLKFEAQTDIEEYQIAGVVLRKAAVYADGRLLFNTVIVADRIIFNEIIYQYQQVSIEYEITL